MPPRRRDDKTLSLFDWVPPAAPAVRYDAPEEVRAASLAATFIRGMAKAEEQSGKSREDIAAAMSGYLQQPVSKAILDQYMSEGREDYVINVVRFLAFMDATRDFRLLSLLAEPFGLAVIEKRYLAAVEEAMYAAEIEEMQAMKSVARRKWKGGLK